MILTWNYKLIYGAQHDKFPQIIITPLYFQLIKDAVIKIS